MPDPADRQAATLAALDRQTETIKARAWPALTEQVIEHVEQAQKGRRSILRRHAPIWTTIRGLADQVNLWACKGCGRPWEECPDWRDAAAGLEVPDAR